MDFKSVLGRHHLIEPIGYGLVRKTRRPRAPVRSAREQFLIHQEVYEFDSPILFIPKPVAQEADGYTMEEFATYSVLPTDCIGMIPALREELTRLRDFLVPRGIYPLGFTILLLVPESVVGWERPCISIDPLYGLVDVSRFSFIQGGVVSVPKVGRIRRCETDVLFEHYITPPPSLTERIATEKNTVLSRDDGI
jgi:hypothetical protein